MYKNTFNWVEPIELAAAVDKTGSDFVFLYSSLLTSYSGRYSYIAYSPSKVLMDALDLERQYGRWFGYLAYEAFDQKKYDLKSYITMPKVMMMQCDSVIVFDHQERKVYSNLSHLPLPSIVMKNNVRVKDLFSNMTRSEYCQNIEDTLAAIVRGDFYQANITRKFYGTVNDDYDAFSIFSNLCHVSPAPYGAFLKVGNYRVISSSPEMFIRLSADGIAENNLIKGTARRFNDPKEDEISRLSLQNSEKDKSENIMIVDLMRNDFARGSYCDSIEVNNLYKIYSYKAVHHALSTIRSKKLKDISSLQFIKGCFPAGSITGAPKIQVRKWCREIEKWERGIYTGSIGWFDSDGSLDLSVVIRTLIMEGNKFEFQVGGGIVYESEPEKELEETLTKASAIAAVLGIDVDRLRAL